MKISTIKHLAYILKCKTSEKEIIEICTQISNKHFEFDNNYYRERKEISIKKNGKTKTRIINPSNGRLKLIQQKIKTNILSSIIFPDYVQGGVRGRSNITNALLHKGNKFKLTTDISRFFPSITPKQVYVAFYNHGFSIEISRILTLLTTYKGRLPQGASTSTHVANMVFSSIDKSIHNYSTEHTLIYTRFIDDITVSSKIDFKYSIPVILEFVTSEGFKISPRKTHYSHIADITGISVGNNIMKPNKQFYERLENDNSETGKRARMNYLIRVKNAKKKPFTLIQNPKFK